jgi:uroporphyrin-III C-methyltransferase/precorrin-2 dehydrogenase/sirohydrochlorin ferrochelatase
MGALQAERVRDALISRGVPASRPVAFIESASAPGERIIRGNLVDLPVLAARLGEGPAIMVIGEAIADARAILTEADAA